MAEAARQSLRMQKELKLLLSDPPPSASFPSLSDHQSPSLTAIDAEMEGPEGTVYAGGIFKIRIQIPPRYPFQPPIVTFATPIYHPNIDTGGRICLDILNLPPKGAWQPSLNISTVITSIGLLLSEPNPDDGLMCEASREFKYNRQAFDLKARTLTDKYAKASSGMASCSQGTQQTVELGSTGDVEVGHEIKTDDSSCITDASKPLSMCNKLSLNLSVSHCDKGGNGKASEVTDPVLSTLGSKKISEPEESSQKVKRTNEVHNVTDSTLSKKKKLSLNLFSQPKQNETVNENSLVNQQVPSRSNPTDIRAVDGSNLQGSKVSNWIQQEPNPSSKGKLPIAYENCKRYTGSKKFSLGFSSISRKHDKNENENLKLFRKSTNEPLAELKENLSSNSVKPEFAKQSGLRGSADTKPNKKICSVEQVLAEDEVEELHDHIKDNCKRVLLPKDLSLSDPISRCMPHQRESTEYQSRNATQNKQLSDPSLTGIVLDSDESDQEERSRCRRSRLSLLRNRPS